MFKNELNKEELETFLKLIEYHDTILINAKDESVIQELIVNYGNDFVYKLLRVQRADMITHDEVYYEKLIKPKLDYICEVYEKKYK